MTTFVDLGEEARRVTEALGGVWRGSSGMALCPAHGDRTPSLSISAGRRTLLFHCFAGCDFTDVVRQVRRLGALSGDRLPIVRAEQGPDVAVRDHAPLARKLFSEARDVPGTLAERYLRGRGLYPPWTDLRFHSRAPIGAGALVTFRPTLVAAVRDCTGLIAVHRIVLDPHTGGKATDLDNPKLTLGKPKRGAVRLAKATRTLGIAEGIETAKSAARMLRIPVWAVLGTERFPLPEADVPGPRLRPQSTSPGRARANP